MNLNKIKLLLIIVFMAPVLVLAQGQPLPSAGITPESPFYFLDRLGEAFQGFFTFNPEGKARLQITFAAERVAEIKVILETKGVEAEGLEVAISRLQAHLANSVSIVTEEKNSGKNVSALAKELDDEFEGHKNALKLAFKVQKLALETKIKELKSKIREARAAGDTALLETLTKELGEVKAEKELLETKEEEQEGSLEEEEEKLEREMEDKDEAETAIRAAEGEKAETLAEDAAKGTTTSAETFEKFDRLLAQAKELLDRGNYQGAEQLAEQAEKSLEKVREAIKDLEDAREEEEELKEEKEDNERGANSRRNGRTAEDAERLEREIKKAEEAAEKAEEQLLDLKDED